MTEWLILALCVAALVAVAAPVVRRELGRRRAKPLPHRPSHTAPTAPGPRHRIADAHTGSLPASQVRLALQLEAEQRQAAMRRRAERPAAASTPRPGGRDR